MWAPLTDEELIRSSELIVVGEWMGNATFSSGGGNAINVGVISATEVLKGTRTTTIVLVVQPSGPVSSSDILYKRGDRGLWLLRPQQNSIGLYAADHPQRFVPAATGQERIKQLRAKI